MASDEETRNTIAALTGATFSIDDTRAQIPKSDGLYAWWIVGSALPGVPASKHATMAQWLRPLQTTAAPTTALSRTSRDHAPHIRRDTDDHVNKCDDSLLSDMRCSHRSGSSIEPRERPL
jgi:hypothetical protein